MVKILKSCFHSEQTNISRQAEADIARGFSIILMAITHVYESFSNYDNHYARIFYLDFCGGPLAAAVFMFCMGLNICYSKRSSPRDLLIRGRNLLLTGVLLSVFRDLFPNLLFFGIDPSFSLENNLIPVLVYTFAEVDILQFTGIFFIVFALMKKANFSLRKMMACAVIFSVLGQFLRDVSTDNFYIDAFTGLFWASHSRVWFPFLNWFIIPVVGYAFGSRWIYCCNKDTFFRVVTPVASFLSAGFFLASRGYQHLETYFVLGVPEAVFAIFTALTVIGHSYYISRDFNRLAQKLSWLSKKITPIYVMHWVLISFIAPAVYLFTGNTNFTIPDRFIGLIGIVILLMTCGLIQLYDRILHRTCD